MAVRIGVGYLDIFGRSNRSQIRRTAEQAGALAGGAFGDKFAIISATVFRATFSAAIVGLGAQVGVFVTQLLGIIPALSSIISLSSLLPAGFIAAVAGAGVLKVAFTGVGDAIKEAFGDDPEKFKESLKSLSPEAQKFVLNIRELVPAFTDVRKGIQDAFFGTGLSVEISKIGGIIQWLTPALKNTAGLFGNIAAAAISFTAQGQSMDVINGVIGALNNGLAAFRGSFDRLAGGIRNVIATVLPLFNAMSIAIGNAAGSFGDWMTRISESGQLMQWIQTALSTLATLGRILANVGSIIMSILAAAEAAGGGALNTFEALTGTFAAFLRSAEGMEALTNFFAGFAAVAQALMPILKAIVSAILPVLGTTLQQLAAVLGPVLLTAVNTLAPALAPLANAFVMIIAALSPVIPVITQVIALIAGVFTQALILLTPVITTLASAIAVFAGPVLGALNTVLMALISALAPVIDAIVMALVPILPMLVNVFTQVVIAVTPLITLLGQFLAQAIQQLLPPIIALIPLIITQMLPAFIQLVPAIMQILIALMPLIPILAQLIVAFTPLIVLMMQLSATLISELLPAIMPLIIIIIQLVVTILGALVPALVPIIKLLADLASLILGVVISALTFLISNAIVPVVSAIASFIAKLVEVISAIVRFSYSIGEKLGSVKDTVANAFSAAGTWLLSAGQKIIDGLIGGISNKIGALKAKVSEAVSAVKNFFPFSPAKEGPLSGRGNPFFSGQSIMNLISEGMLSQIPQLQRSASLAASSLSPASGLPEAIVAASTGIAAVQPTNTSANGSSNGVNRTYSITVNALDPRSAASAVIEAISAWERSNGTGWRTP